jgi:LuxR family maltose regulon positive regulatory protein
MTDLLGTSSVRTALLHRPPPPEGALERSELLAALDAGLDCAATMVVAPAGYGKSVLVSQWSQRLDQDVAWISLDAPVDDLHGFLRHLVAAVRLLAPDSLTSTALLADGGVLPADQVVITTLSNELDELDQPLVVVFDDYHVIGASAVHQLLSELLTHPPESVHFVIVTRRDPPLPVGSLRARGRLGELRMADLRFSASESALVVQGGIGRSLSDAEASAVWEATEGWAAGLRLTVQAMRRGSGIQGVVGAGHLDRGAQEYLVAEVLDHVAPDLLGFLITASLFDRFSAELCDAAMAASTSGPVLLTGPKFIDWLQRENLFVIPLDDDGTWFRFHHLFRRLLDDWRQMHATSLGIQEAELHAVAARLMREHGFVEEAIREFELAGELDELVALATVHGNRLIDEARWGDLSTLLAALPADLVDDHPALLVLRAWLVGDHGGRYRAMLDLLDRAEARLDGDPADVPSSQELRGQIAVLRGLYERLSTGDFDGAVADAQLARDLLGVSPGAHLASAYTLGTVALANSGRYDEARRLADAVVGDERFADSPVDPVMWVMPFLAWVEGSLDALEQAGSHLLAAGERSGLRLPWGHYFLGTSAYERNDLTTAEEHLAVSVDVRYTVVQAPLHSAIALAFTELATGRPTDALLTGKAMVEDVLTTRGDYHLPTAEAAMALLQLRTGNVPAALRWAKTAEPDVPGPRYMFFDRTPALIEILLSSQPNVARGRALLDIALESPYGKFNRPVNVKLLGLAALADLRKGDDDSALRYLRAAVQRAHEGGMVRSLADLGPELVPLLHRLDVSGSLLDHVGLILRSIEPVPSSSGLQRETSVVPDVAGEPGLTDRESDILRLLAERYSNKEISRELTIAPATVKKHTVTLYQKLNVHGRRQAVAKARVLGYLRERAPS